MIINSPFLAESLRKLGMEPSDDQKADILRIENFYHSQGNLGELVQF